MGADRDLSLRRARRYLTERSKASNEAETDRTAAGYTTWSPGKTRTEPEPEPDLDADTGANAGTAFKSQGSACYGSNIPLFHVSDAPEAMRGTMEIPVHIPGHSGVAAGGTRQPGTGRSQSPHVAVAGQSTTLTPEGITAVIDCLAARFELVLRYDESWYEDE